MWIGVQGYRHWPALAQLLPLLLPPPPLAPAAAAPLLAACHLPHPPALPCTLLFPQHIRDITDPEHPYTLEQLSVVSEEAIEVDDTAGTVQVRSACERSVAKEAD